MMPSLNFPFNEPLVYLEGRNILQSSNHLIPLPIPRLFEAAFQGISLKWCVFPRGTLHTDFFGQDLLGWAFTPQEVSLTNEETYDSPSITYLPDEVVFLLQGFVTQEVSGSQKLPEGIYWFNHPPHVVVYPDNASTSMGVSGFLIEGRRKMTWVRPYMWTKYYTSDYQRELGSIHLTVE